MEKRAGSEPMFLLQRGDDILLRFTRETNAGDGSLEFPMCDLRVQPGDLMPFMIFLGERRGKWPQWWSIGEREGRDVSGQRIAARWIATVGDPPSAFDVDVHADRSGIDLVAEFPRRTARIAKHRFVDERAATLFVDRYLAADQATLWTVFQTACLLPRPNLTELIESMVGGRSESRSGSTMFRSPSDWIR